MKFKRIRGKLTHFSPATGSAVHLQHVPATEVTQGNSETQKDDRSVEVVPGSHPSCLWISICVKLHLTLTHRLDTKQDVARHNSVRGTGRGFPHPTLRKSVHDTKVGTLDCSLYWCTAWKFSIYTMSLSCWFLLKNKVGQKRIKGKTMPKTGYWNIYHLT